MRETLIRYKALRVQPAVAEPTVVVSRRMSRRTTEQQATSTAQGDTVELHATARKLVAACLDLIEEGGHPRTANLRQIAARIGCAHTSAYNYFTNHEEILWHALVEGLGRFLDFTQSQLAAVEPGPGLVRAAVAAEAEFAVSHPGVYRLMFFEVMSTPPPAALVPQLEVARRWFTEMIQRASGGTVSSQAAQRIGNIVHGYAHGDISKLLHGRTVVRDRAEAARKIAENAERLFSLLVADLAATRANGKKKLRLRQAKPG